MPMSEPHLMDNFERAEFLEKLSAHIMRVYANKEDTLYRQLCSRDLNIDDTLLAIFSKWGNWQEDVHESTYPSKNWQIRYSAIETSSFYACFKSRLSISKICPVFRIVHNFSIKNYDENGLEDMIEGRCGLDYDTAEHIHAISLHIDAELYLNQRGYTKIPAGQEYIAAYTAENKEAQFTIKDLLFTNKYHLWKKHVLQHNNIHQGK